MAETLREVADNYYSVEETQEVFQRSRQQIYTYAEQKQWRKKKWRNLTFFFKRDVDRTKEELQGSE